jgi:hypothetical protein
MGVHSERSAPQPGSVKGEAGMSVRTNRSSTSSEPRSKPSADAPRCANEQRWTQHAISHHIVSQGRHARSKGLRKKQFDGRHAAVSNLQVAPHYVEELQLAS